MSEIAITIRYREADAEKVVTVKGDDFIGVDVKPWLSPGLTYGAQSKPDRITITLTEREAELVNGITGKANRAAYQSGQHADAIRWALCGANAACGITRFTPGGVDCVRTTVENHGYAHAERDINSDHGNIRLTMDRDVAVTLLHLVYCVSPRGELDELRKTLDDLVGDSLGEDRFTGTIKWKRRRLKTYDCEVGAVYKLVTRPSLAQSAEWEPVE